MSITAWLSRFVAVSKVTLAACDFLLKLPLNGSEEVEARLPVRVVETKSARPLPTFRLKIFLKGLVVPP